MAIRSKSSSYTYVLLDNKRQAFITQQKELNMPLPLIVIIPALIAGGSLVPHAAGGMMVASVAGYVAGTYLSTAAITGLIAATSNTLGTGALFLSGAAGSIIDSAGVYGATVGASGITGSLMSAGIIASTPILAPVVITASAFTAAGAGVMLAVENHKEEK
jgi:hypothetical protein